MVPRRFIVSLLWASGLLLGQAPASQVFPTFDIRQTTGAAGPTLKSEAYRAAAASFSNRLAGSQADQLQVSAGRFGLPRSLTIRGAKLSAASTLNPSELARSFLRSAREAFPFSDQEIQDFSVESVTGFGGNQLVRLRQTVAGIEVFRGGIRVLVAPGGEVLEAGADEAVPGLRVDPSPRVAPEEAVRLAYQSLGITGLRIAAKSERDGQVAIENPFRPSAGPLSAGLVVFALAPGEGRLAWRIYLVDRQWQAWLILIDASGGDLLYRQSLTLRAGQARVWKVSPIDGARETVAFAGGWLAAGADTTRGNNVEAYLDADSDNSPDPGVTDDLHDGRAYSASQNFDFPAGEGSGGQDPRNFRAASVSSLFYFVNLAHDYFYALGFDEKSGNFQEDNFSKGGLGSDGILAESQDPELVNNASFSPAPDGRHGRIEMGLFTQRTFRGTDDLDSSYSGEVVFHEYAHGVSTRLAAGAADVSCLYIGQSGALGEGWSDYFSMSYFNLPLTGRYLSERKEAGIRRFSYENYPLTYADLGNDGFEPHNDGEIWAAALWDLRKTIGAADADRLILGAIKLTPCDPSMIDARDALFTAEQSLFQGAHKAALWTVFARHGMGFSASSTGRAEYDYLTFTAAFDLPPDMAPGVNRFPKITSRPDKIPGLGEQFQYQIKASDPDGDALRYELVSGPAGMVVDPATGLVQWVAAFTGKRAVVAVTDAKGGKVLHGFYVFTETLVTLDQTIQISGEAYSTGFARVTIPSSLPVLQITLRGGKTEVDLLVMDVSGRTYISSRFGPNETLTFARPRAGRWQIAVVGSDAYEGVRFSVTAPNPVRIEPNRWTPGLSGDESSETYYQFTVPAGTSKVVVSAGYALGDIDLYLSRETFPTCPATFFSSEPCVFDYSSENYGSAERIEIPRPAPGEYFINVSAWDQYEGLALIVSMGDPSAPAISNGSAGSAATYKTTLVPGGIATVFGQNLASTTASAGSFPLPRELAGTRVQVSGVDAPLFFVSPSQINFQVPFEIDPLERAAVVVIRGGVPSSILPVEVSPMEVGLFTYTRGSSVVDPVITHADGSLVSPQNPAKPGEVLVAFSTGMGGLDNPPLTGAAASSSPLAAAGILPEVTLGGKPVDVLFAGLTPGFAGLAQYNLRLPSSFSGITAGGGRTELTLPLKFSLPFGFSEVTYQLYICGACP